jgi:lactobin A/cerein 7B family class IIb bacteriocin
MINKNCLELNDTEIREINGGVIPLIAYAAAYAAIIGGAATVAYYKGYSDAGETIEPCYEKSPEFKYTN